jgi:acyl-CoA synthetase (NDP forming)
MLADHAEKIGLCFPTISPSAAQILKSLLPSIATVSNPLDYTTPIWGQPERTGPVFAAVMTGLGVDAALLVQDYPLSGLDASKVYYQNDAAAFADAADALGVPAAICATLPENLDGDTREFLIRRGVAPMQGIHETMNAISQAASWDSARSRILCAPPAPLRAPSCGGVPHVIDEAGGKAWLAAAGLIVPDGRRTNAGGAGDAADALGYPVALKMMSPKLAHKTEAGAVVLSLDSHDAVMQAARSMRMRVAAHDPSAVTDDFLVERMSPRPLAELIVSVRRDPQFGLALTLGSGGVLVELIGDSATVLLPCSPRDIEAALTGLKAARLLGGFRGAAPADITLIAGLLHDFCMRLQDIEGGFVEVEINPLFVYPASIVAIDVLLQVEASS